MRLRCLQPLNLPLKSLYDIVFPLQVVVCLLQKTGIVEVLALDSLVVLAEFDHFGADLPLQGLYLVLEELVLEVEISVCSLELLILVAQFII